MNPLEYYKRLLEFDWRWEYSDDPGVGNAARAEFLKLEQIARTSSLHQAMLTAVGNALGIRHDGKQPPLPPPPQEYG